jgi:hypothetical protein
MARTPCGSTVVWSVQPSLVTPDGADAAIAAAYEQVGGPARLNVVSGTGGTVRYLWIDRGTGSSETPGTSQGTSVIGNTAYTQHAYLPGAKGDALQAQVLADVLRDLGVSAPTSGTTLSPEDAAALTARCAATAEPTEPAPDAAVAPEVDLPPSPTEAVPRTTDRPTADKRLVSRTVGGGLVGVAVAGVALYVLLPLVLPRLRRKTATDSAGSTS